VKWIIHLSDDVPALALAHNAADRQASPAAGAGVPKTAHISRSQQELTYGPNEPTLLSVGGVSIVEEEMNPPRHLLPPCIWSCPRRSFQSDCWR
jgi:hypothetical protein